MKKLTLILSLFIVGGSYAQPTFEWVNTMGNTSSDNGKEVVLDASGNVYVLGEFRNTVDFDPGAGTTNLTAFGNTDVFLQKLDSDGNLIWVKQFGGTDLDQASALVIDGNNDLIITGQFSGTSDFDPGAGTATLTTSGNRDTYIVKLDNNGNFSWVKQLDATHHCYAEDMGVNSSNEIILTGRWFGTGDFDPGTGTSNLTATGAGWDIYILKLTAAGNYVWVSAIAGSDNNYNQALAVDQLGNVLISGYYYDTIDLDPGPGSVSYTAASGQEDMFLVKLDANGAYVWGHNFVSSLTEMAHSIHVDANNDYYFGGWFSATMDFDPGSGTVSLTPAGSADCFLLKLDASGAFQWVNQMGGPDIDKIFSVTSDSQGDILVAGIFSGTADLDPGTGTANFTSNGNHDVFIQKVSSAGAYQWTVAFGGTSIDYVNSIAAGSNGEILATGNYGSTVDFDPGTGVANGTAVGANDTYVQKLKECTTGALLVLDQATLPDLNDACSVAAPTTPTASTCAQTFNGTPDVTFPITAQGTTVVTWTFDDGGGQTLTQTQNVIITDVTAPVADNATLADVTSECSVTSLTAPTATDNCAGIVTGSHNATLPIITQGTTPVTWTYDDGNGNTSTQTQNIVITDVTAPVADNATLTDVTSECPVTSLTAPTATDNCAGTVTGSHNATLPISAAGTTTVTWTYDDGNGNTATQTQDVVIIPIDVTTTSGDVNGSYEIAANATGYNYQWIGNCGGSNDQINGATSINYAPTSNGSYAVIIDNGSCADTSDCVTIETLDVDESHPPSNVLVYPNPTSGLVTVMIPGANISATAVAVFDMKGRQIAVEMNGSLTTEQAVTFDAKKLVSGIYIVVISVDDRLLKKRLVVQ